MTEPTLLPCPFCGGLGDIWGTKPGKVFVACMECGAASDPKAVADDDAAIAKWNARAQPSTPPVLPKPAAFISPSGVAYTVCDCGGCVDPTHTPLYAATPPVLREAAIAFLDKLDLIEPYITSLHVLAENRGMPYRGPNYAVEKAALRAALSQSLPPAVGEE